MKKNKLSIGITSALVLISVIVITQSQDSEIKQDTEIVIEGDVIMPTKVSRPGCEETDSCYIPSIITVNQGRQITWLNEDAAFHSVTSGSYGEPSGLFDSGYLDPGQPFSIDFDEKGTFDYFCTLHPWMKGKVIVE
ncbi:MAG: cupredoxin domain-containing protein [Nitrosopumilus sp.]|nr:cupredoxin domain-containing protein [Nitrosopumilus sp.]